MKGFMFDPNKIGIGTNAVFADVGAKSVAYMRGITEQTEHEGQLTDSITWKMSDRGSNVGSRATKKDEIEKPSKTGVLRVGSGAEHAVFREDYSGMHHFGASKEESELFIKRMKKWAMDVLGIDGSDTGRREDKSAFWRIVKSIRDNDTPQEHGAHAFVAPTVEMVPQFVAQSVNNAIARKAFLMEVNK